MFGIWTSAWLRFLCIGAVVGCAGFMAQERLKVGDLFSEGSMVDSTLYVNSIQTIGLVDFLQLYHRFGSFVVDARDAGSYEYGHIKNAISLPAKTFTSVPDNIAEKLRKATVVIVYCSSMSCSESFFIAQQLKKNGVDSVMVYPQGWNEWVSCFLPVVMSIQMKSDMATDVLNKNIIRIDATNVF